MALSFTIPAALVAIFVALLLKRLTRKSLHLPPGPKPLPIVGNLLDMPSGASWAEFSPMSKQYGDIMYFKVINQHTIIISSVEVAADLFEKRSTIYSDRYHSVSLTDLMGDDWSFILQSYGEDWRKRRKIFHQYLGPSAVREFDGHLSEHIGGYLKRLKATPEHMFEHTRWMVVAILMNIIYGIHVEDVSNKHVAEAEAWVAGVNQVLEPGRFLVDILPFLQHIPAWFPGANFKRLLFGWRENMYNARDGPFYEAKDAYTAGTSRNCVVTRILENIGDKSDSSEQETISRDSLGSAFGAGVDTSAPTLQIFFHAMMAHPEIQKRAQTQLDAVVGSDRHPTLNDRDQLPYIDAILKEVTRSVPVTPLALAHFTATDDEYRGYHIPKGSVVIPVCAIFSISKMKLAHCNLERLVCHCHEGFHRY
ncbi:hypothetical protein QCA50_007646 [Cerrena zonata]|uniref:Cytochrome P450 n=1 Tax=Cerrena zonata TaxID=2478898 RepID=A0AAW0GCS5_9APHY